MFVLIRRIVRRVMSAALLAALAGSRATAQSPGTGETEVKAVFLYNFGKYVEWPDSAFPDGPASPLRVCVMADEAFRRSVARVIAGESIHGHPMALSTPDTPAAIAECHILFVDGIDAEATRTLLHNIPRRPTLLVGNGPAFLNEGGAIAFVLDQQRVRFDINRAAAADRGVTISAKLLRVARRVKEQ